MTSSNKKMTLEQSIIGGVIDAVHDIDHKEVVLKRLKETKQILEDRIDQLQIDASDNLMASIEGLALTMRVKDIIQAIYTVKQLRDDDPNLILASLEILGESDGSDKH